MNHDLTAIDPIQHVSLAAMIDLQLECRLNEQTVTLTVGQLRDLLRVVNAVSAELAARLVHEWTTPQTTEDDPPDEEHSPMPPGEPIPNLSTREMLDELNRQKENRGKPLDLLFPIDKKADAIERAFGHLAEPPNQSEPPEPTELPSRPEPLDPTGAITIPLGRACLPVSESPGLPPGPLADRIAKLITDGEPTMNGLFDPHRLIQLVRTAHEHPKDIDGVTVSRHLCVVPQATSSVIPWIRHHAAALSVLNNVERNEYMRQLLDRRIKFNKEKKIK